MMVKISTVSDECLVDSDCPFSKACIANECIDPCNKIICGNRALCKSEFHKAICYCPTGLQGNPLVSCLEVGCTSNSDCASREKCDFESSPRKCQPLCIFPKCARGASCEPINHQEICTCNFPLIGDGYSSCLERKFIIYEYMLNVSLHNNFDHF